MGPSEKVPPFPVPPEDGGRSSDWNAIKFSIWNDEKCPEFQSWLHYMCLCNSLEYMNIAQNITMILTELVDVWSFQSLFCKWTQIKAWIFSTNNNSRYVFKQQQIHLPHQSQAAVKITVFSNLTPCSVVERYQKFFFQWLNSPLGA